MPISPSNDIPSPTRTMDIILSKLTTKKTKPISENTKIILNILFKEILFTPKKTIKGSKYDVKPK